MVKYIWFLFLIVEGCLGNVDSSNIEFSDNKGDNPNIENIITSKNTVNTLFKQIMPKIEKIDGVPILDINTIPLETLGEVDINSLLVTGISKFTKELEVYVINATTQFGVDITMDWKDETTLDVNLKYNLALKPEELSFLNGPGEIDLQIKNSALILYLELNNLKLQNFDIRTKFSESTVCNLFKIGELDDYKDLITKALQNQDIMDIITGLLSEIIKIIMEIESRSNEVEELMKASIKHINKDFILDLIQQTQNILK